MTHDEKVDAGLMFAAEVYAATGTPLRGGNPYTRRRLAALTRAGALVGNNEDGYFLPSVSRTTATEAR